MVWLKMTTPLLLDFFPKKYLNLGRRSPLNDMAHEFLELRCHGVVLSLEIHETHVRESWRRKLESLHFLGLVESGTVTMVGWLVEAK